MASEPVPHRPDAEVVPVRATETGTEVELAGAQPPAYLDLTPADAMRRRPIIPVGLRRENLRGTVTQQAGLRWHQTSYTACGPRSTC